ncbi:MAG: hypothetical protein SVV03_04555 [Candidatus Nanohaloarchaea archaeon]|nr:hypothetical protein [Candidatus Nanohaloarchaea archaeon]
MAEQEIARITSRDGYLSVAFKKNEGLLKKLVDMLIDVSGPEDVDMRCSVRNMLVKEDFGDFEEGDDSFRHVSAEFRDVHDMVDERYGFSGKGFSVDLIFGRDKVFLIGYMDDEFEEKTREFLEENFEFA